MKLKNLCLLNKRKKMNKMNGKLEERAREEKRKTKDKHDESDVKCGHWKAYYMQNRKVFVRKSDVHN